MSAFDEHAAEQRKRDEEIRRGGELLLAVRVAKQSHAQAVHECNVFREIVSERMREVEAAIGALDAYVARLGQ